MSGKNGKVYLIRAVAPDLGGTYSNVTTGDLYSVEMEGTDLTSGLTLTPKGATAAVKNPRTTIGHISVTGSLGTLAGKTTDLLGDVTIATIAYWAKEMTRRTAALARLGQALGRDAESACMVVLRRRWPVEGSTSSRRIKAAN